MEMSKIIETLKDGTYNNEMQLFRTMDRNITINNWKPFSIEHELSIEEKLQIMDLYSDDKASYMLKLITDWMNIKDTLPKDQWGNPKTVSRNAWLKKNDTKKIVYVKYNQTIYYYMYGTQHHELDDICGRSEYGNNYLYTEESIVNQWFYDWCVEREKEENKFFQDNDPKQLKIKQLKEYAEKYGVFNCKLLNDVVWNKQEITDKDLEYFLSVYSDMDNYCNNQIKKITDAGYNMYK